jgi:hypothetical protein
MAQQLLLQQCEGDEERRKTKRERAQQKSGYRARGGGVK